MTTNIVVSLHQPQHLPSTPGVSLTSTSPTDVNSWTGGATAIEPTIVSNSSQYSPVYFQVCREFQRGACTRAPAECRFAHPPESVAVDAADNCVTVCMDFIKGKCARELCRYCHPPPHLHAQIKASSAHAHHRAVTAATAGFVSISAPVVGIHSHLTAPSAFYLAPLLPRFLASLLPRFLASLPPTLPPAHCLHPARFPVFCRSPLLPDYFLTLTAARTIFWRFPIRGCLLTAFCCALSKWDYIALCKSVDLIERRYTFENCLWKLKWGQVRVRVTLVSDTERQDLYRYS